MSEAPQKKGTSWSIGIGLGIVALLIGTAIVTEPSVSFSSSGNRGCAPAGTETPLRLQTNTLSISAPGIVKASYLTMLSPSVSIAVIPISNGISFPKHRLQLLNTL